MQKSFSLLEAHKQSLQGVLDPQNSKFNGQQIQEDQISPWKILIFDTLCQNILSTLYRVGDLRELCITLHLNVNQKREKLHGVTVIYFLLPSPVNIQKIIDDFQRELYSQVIINFCCPIRGDLLDQLAKGIEKIPGAASKVEKVFEHNLNFSSLNLNLFSFNMQDVYGKIPSNNQQLADHLYSLISTLKVQPIIISQLGRKHKLTPSLPPAALAVSNLLIEHLKRDEDLSQDHQTVTLLLLERDEDLNQVLQHSNTYAGLMHDIFRLRNNKIDFVSESGTVQYDLSPLNDSLWSQAMNMPYPEAAELIEAQLASWKSEYDRVINRDGAASDQLTNMLSSALDLVPQLQSQKRNLDQHVNIATTIMQHVKQRRLDKFYQCGLSIIQQSQAALQEARDLFLLENPPLAPKDTVKDYEYLRELDKTRILSLLLMNHISNQQFSEEFTKLETLAGIKNPDLKKALMYLKNKVGFQVDKQLQRDQTQSDYKGYLKGFANKMKTHLNVVNNLLPTKEKRCAVVQIIESLFDEFKQQDLQEYFKIFDSQKLEYVDSIQLSNVREIIVCVLEGASYNEYAEVSEYAKMSNRSIIYGGCEVLNGEDLIKYFIQSSN